MVPFWVCYGFLVRDYNILPKTELHIVWVSTYRLWVLGSLFGFRVMGLEFRVWGLGV